MTHLVYGIDDRYLPPLLVSVYSALTTATDHLRCTVFTSGPNQSIQTALDKLSDFFPSSDFCIRDFQSSDFATYEQTGIAERFPPASLIPLYVPWLINDKCLFLDADTLFLQDVGELFHTDLKGNLIGATLLYTDAISIRKYFLPGILQTLYPSRVNRRRQDHLQTASRTGFSLEELQSKFFSSGIILMDTAAIRAADPTQDLVKKDRFHESLRVLPDQELLNMSFKDKALFLDLKWNVYRDEVWLNKLFAPYRLRTQIDAACAEPGMLHFPHFYRRKPWQRPWYKSRKRYRLYRNVCQELEDNLSIPIFRMFDDRLTRVQPA